MSKNKEIKKEVIENVSKSITRPNGKASTVVFDYSGITVNEFNDLRNKLIETDSELQVVKNTLIKLALIKSGVDMKDSVEGQNSVLLSNNEDLISPIKKIFEFIKAKEKGVIRFGVLDNTVLTAEKVEALSKLPSREVLIAQVLGLFNSPIRGFAYTLNGVQSKFVYVLEAIKKQKAGGE